MTNTAAMGLARQTVLVADDSRVIRKAVNTILADNYEVIEASNGEEALAVLHENAMIHAVLLDLWMPDMDGFEVLEAMRSSALKRLVSLPVIIVTGHDDDSDMRGKAQSLGASDFIGKPFSAAELRASVQNHILPVDATNVIPFKSGSSAEVEQQEEAAGGSSEDSAARKKAVKTSTAEQLRLKRRAHLAAEGEKILQRALKTHRPLSVLRLQVDRVKGLLHKTDTEFTKRTLFKIHKLVEQETRRKDVVVRMGAADFTIILPVTDGLEAKEIGKSIYRVLRHTAFLYNDMKFRLSLSGGLASPKMIDGLQFETIVELAEVRMERAYNSGGDQLIFEDLQAGSGREGKPISLDEAASQLRTGQTATVKTQVKRLLIKMLPLLVFANSAMDLNIDDAIRKIHERIQGG